MLKNSLPRWFVRGPVLLRVTAAPLFLVLALGMFGCAHSMPGLTVGTGSAPSRLYWQDEPGIGSRVRLVVTPTNLTVQSGQQILFKAVAVDQGSVPVRWTSSAGSISEQGLFIAPTVSSAQTVTITATGISSNVFTRGSVTITVTANAKSAVTITTQVLPQGTSGTPYAASLSATGGRTPYTWSLASGSLPSGITIAGNSGMITGSTTQSGTFALGLRVVDATGGAATQQFGLTVSNAGNPGSCGPPSYSCSRTDLEVASLPNPIPSVGNLSGANTGITDPDFHNPITRLTDAGTNPNAEGITFVAAAGGSSNANTWNTDSTLILLQDTNATGYPMTFDATTMHAARMYVSSSPTTGGMTITNTHFSWSRVNPSYLYVLSKTQILLYDFTNRAVPPSPQLVYDFTSSPNCLPSGFTPTWQDFGGVAAGDAAFLVGLSNIGPQGTGTYVAIYTVGQGCSVLNTQTGLITSDWGQTGTITTPDRITLHDAFLTKSSGWAILGRTDCLSSNCSAGPYFWQVGTTEVVPCGVGSTQLCGGHWTVGYSHWANNDGDPFGQYHFRPFSDLGSFSPIVSSLPIGFVPPVDQHPSWNNVDPNDSVPFISSTWTTIAPFTTAWQNEILAISPTTGTVSRFAHNFITAASQRFDDQEAIGQVSQDGRFFLFNSDWMGTLGSESGSSHCTIGKDCRGDVFVVQLN